MIKFERDETIKEKIKDIVETLNLDHIDLNRLSCVRSKGSGAKRTIARCYALSKIWQLSLNLQAHYIIEIISEKYDRLSESEKTKVLMHELLHIPFSFGGGFKHHDYVTNKRIDELYEKYKKIKNFLKFRL